MGEANVLGVGLLHAVLLSIYADYAAQRGVQCCFEAVREPWQLITTVCQAVHRFATKNTGIRATARSKHRAQAAKIANVFTNGEADEQDIHQHDF